MKGNLAVVYKVFKERKALTDLELQGFVNLNPNSVRPARLNLLRMGAIRKTEEKRAGYTVYKVVRGFKFEEVKAPKKTDVLQTLRNQRNALRELISQTTELIGHLTKTTAK